ncbi:MAG: hypothetical protein AAF830_05300 [Pseudomonadota bacterium]
MHVLVERRYIFKRREKRGRVAFAAIAAALTGMTVQVADATTTGGYRAEFAVDQTAPLMVALAAPE